GGAAVRLLGDQPRQASVSGGEEVTVPLTDAAIIEVAGAEVIAGLERHVAAGAVGLHLGRVVEAASAVADTGQLGGVEVILAAQELLVLVQLDRQADLVAGRAEVRRLVERLEEGLLVEVRVGLDELVVE